MLILRTLLKRTDASGSSVDPVVSCVGLAPGALRAVLNSLGTLGGVFCCAGPVARVFLCADSHVDRYPVVIAVGLLRAASAVLVLLLLLRAVLNDVLDVRTQRTALVIAASVLLRAVLIMNGLVRPHAGSAAGDDLGFSVFIAAELRLHAVLILDGFVRLAGSAAETTWVSPLL